MMQITKLAAKQLKTTLKQKRAKGIRLYFAGMG